ncbi:MAG: hypothetical protein MUE54_02130 [Anaerolineae bacterium]|nr:hypothetical protein [Anaerolineae bacterium]
MNNQLRWNITIRVWLAAIIVGFTINTPSMPSIWYTITSAILATIFIWGGVVFEAIFKKMGASARPTPQQTQSPINDKAYKLAVLLEMMDEDEREEFKHQLKNDLMSSGDSESLSIESLITEKRKRG